MDDRMRAIKYQSPKSIPIHMSLLPAAWLKYGERLQPIRARHPRLFGEVSAGDEVKYYVPDRYRQGKHVDPWGCVWENIKEGYDAIVTGHPLPTRESVHSLRPPQEDAGIPHGFMFLRLTDLRGFEEMMVDFAEEPPELQMLLDIVRDYNLSQVPVVAAQTEGDMMYFGDDNGMQHALPISPVKWRKYLKPCYTAIYKAAHDLGKLVYMHTDGCIFEVIPDMIECGVDVLNPQIRANGLDNLVRTCKGKVCINLDLDRQLFPFATPREIDDHVRECVEAMYLQEGGLMLTAECAADVPLENIEAICAAMEKYADFSA